MHRLATVHARDNQRPTNQRRHDTAYLNKSEALNNKRSWSGIYENVTGLRGPHHYETTVWTLLPFHRRTTSSAVAAAKVIAKLLFTPFSIAVNSVLSSWSYTRSRARLSTSRPILDVIT